MSTKIHAKYTRSTDYLVKRTQGRGSGQRKVIHFYPYSEIFETKVLVERGKKRGNKDHRRDREQMGS